MKKITALFVLIFALFALAACSPGDDTPEGMQLVFGGEEAGYCFYAPEDWLVSNIGEIKSAYISRVNTTSVSFVKVELPDIADKATYFFTSYFNDNAAEFAKLKDFALLESGKDISFGMGEYAATKAQQYIYGYEYAGHKFAFMQILVQHDEDFFLFTYSALNEAEEGVTPNYEKYLDKAKSVIDNFRFTGPNKETPDTTEYERDEDNYKLITDKAYSGFEFYVPDSFEPNYSSAIVSASTPDGSNVNMTKATSTGVYATTYWEMRKTELSAFASDITEIEINKETKLGNNSSTFYKDWAYSYEYTFKYGENVYHVYQILAIDGMEGYVFTYTALEENYLKHFDEVLSIIEKVRF